MEVVRKKPGRKPGRPVVQAKSVEKVETQENTVTITDNIYEQQNSVTHIEASTEIKSRSNRPKRTPLFKQRVLTANERPGYTRRWVTEKPGRLEAFQEAGWNFVTGNVDEIRDVRAQNASQIGSAIKQCVNPNVRDNAQNAYLMEVPTEWYEEDQKAKREIIREREAALDPKKYQQKDRAFYGSMKIEQN